MSSVTVTQTHEPIYGRFVARPNRFRVEVRLEGGRQVAAYCPNPGRMMELFTGGETVSLRRALPPAEATTTVPASAAKPPGRVTAYDLLGVRYQGLWVSIDSRLPNALVGAALEAGALSEFEGWRVVRPEYTWGASRFDFLLAGPKGRKGLLEVKSCTLVEEGLAKFPDAPTLRGARHLRELATARAEGYHAWALFCIQRPDARVWRPHAAMDPPFAAACRQAAEAGVRLLAYGCDFDGAALTLGRRVTVELGEAGDAEEAEDAEDVQATQGRSKEPGPDRRGRGPSPPAGVQSTNLK